jgi:hypothetical protein
VETADPHPALPDQPFNAGALTAARITAQAARPPGREWRDRRNAVSLGDECGLRKGSARGLGGNFGRASFSRRLCPRQRGVGYPQVRRTLIADNDFRRLDIPMDYALLMGILQGLGDDGDQLGTLA